MVRRLRMALPLFGTSRLCWPLNWRGAGASVLRRGPWSSFPAGCFSTALKSHPATNFCSAHCNRSCFQARVQHIFRGSLTRFVLEQSVLLLGVTLLWCFAATVGRAATLRRLVAMFSARRRTGPDDLAICADLRPASAARSVVVDRGLGGDRVLGHRRCHGGKGPRRPGRALAGLREPAWHAGSGQP